MKKMDQSMWRSPARSRTKSTSRNLGAVLAQYAQKFSIHSAYLLKRVNKKLSGVMNVCQSMDASTVRVYRICLIISLEKVKAHLLTSIHTL